MTNIAGFKRIHDRKRKFHEKMVEVENELSGRMTSIIPYVTDDAGVFDAHKAKEMIDELVKDMVLCQDLVQIKMRSSAC